MYRNHVPRGSGAIVWMFTPAAVGSLLGTLAVALLASMCHMLGPFVGWQASQVQTVRAATADEIESRVTEIRRLVESRGYGRAPGFPEASCIGDRTCSVSLSPTQPKPPAYRSDVPPETPR